MFVVMYVYIFIILNSYHTARNETYQKDNKKFDASDQADINLIVIDYIHEGLLQKYYHK